MATNERFQLILTARDEASRTVNGVTGSIGKMVAGVAAATVAMSGLTRFLGSAITVGAKFERTMATVAGVVRATAGEEERLTEIAREMGRATEFSATQAGEALQFLGMAGFSAAKSIAALPGVLDLATAAQVGLGRSADIASNALTAMGLEVDQLQRVNDVFIGTMTRSNVNMEQMAESFKFAAPLAKAYGVTLEDLAGLIGTLGNAGIQGSMAGTQLAMAFQESARAAVALGMRGASLMDVLKRLRDTHASTTEVMELFSQRAARAALVLMGNIDGARQLQETLKGVAGETAELAERMRNTTEGAMKEFASAWESLKITIFNSNESILESTIRMATGVVRALEGIVKASREVAAIQRLIREQEQGYLQPGEGFWKTFYENFSKDSDEYKARMQAEMAALLAPLSGRDLLPLIPGGLFDAPSTATFGFDTSDVRQSFERYSDEFYAVADEAEDRFREMHSILESGFVDAFVKIRTNSAGVFKQMAEDFERFFLRQIFSNLAGQFAFKLLQILDPTGVSTATNVASASGSTFSSFAPKVAPAAVNIYIGGDIIGEETYIRSKIIPQIERAAAMGQSRLALGS